MFFIRISFHSKCNDMRGKQWIGIKLLVGGFLKFFSCSFFIKFTLKSCQLFQTFSSKNNKMPGFCMPMIGCPGSIDQDLSYDFIRYFLSSQELFWENGSSFPDQLIECFNIIFHGIKLKD